MNARGIGRDLGLQSEWVEMGSWEYFRGRLGWDPKMREDGWARQ